jgi:hypothetical protein
MCLRRISLPGILNLGKGSPSPSTPSRCLGLKRRAGKAGPRGKEQRC